MISLDNANFQDRGGSKDVSQLPHRLIWIKVGWKAQVNFFESTADTTLCYPRQKLLCVYLWEIISAEIEGLETWCLVADNFYKHFYSTFSVIIIILTVNFEPWYIGTKIKMLNGGDWGVEKGLQNDLSCSLKTFVTLTKLLKIKMYKCWAVLDYIPKQKSQTHSWFLWEMIHFSQLKMLKVGATLY